ncbi:hypothetical protein VF21_05743 [Pseudogymnoascus sp. 05NY08]|nr:hypothetical protein VF21_05743 [Pseudogymnoascus sp. 05NY08]
MSLDADVIIIGAGISGLCLAIQLVRNHPNITFQLLEKSDSIGGTWHVNTYPGCGCDVPSHFFSYSFELNPNWSQKFALQPEIEKYYHDVAMKYDIPKRVQLHTIVTNADWDDSTNTWRVYAVNTGDNKPQLLRSKVLISAVGALSVPRGCDLPGADRFKGRIFHSATWDHTFDYTNKEVVVLGNGCSATQFVPELSRSVKKITQFARQPHWLLERPNPKYSNGFKLAMRCIPGLMRTYRAMIYAELEAEFAMFAIDTGAKTRAELSRKSRKYIEENAPKKYVSTLIPEFEVGCKRRVFDTGYLECLHRDAVELVSQDPVEEILEDAVRLKSGRVVAADAIVLANGFETLKMLHPMEIRGVKGKSLGDHWSQVSDGVPQAYFGTCVSGFPNFAIMMGPNTTTGHLSVIFTSECQVNFILRVLKPVLESLHPTRSLKSLILPPQTAGTVDVTIQAEVADNDWIQATANKLVWASGCTSWYVDKKTKKNVALYPSWEWHYWLRSVFIKKSHFNYQGLRRDRVFTRLLLFTVLAISSLFWRKW